MAELTLLATARAEQSAADKESMLEFLDGLREQVVKGELKGFLVITEDQEEYIYTRRGFTFQEAIGLHTRAAYKLNQEWDE